ncbi:DNA adenine methylase [Staphylococcus haemolyticus]|uniref:DNA adenine methylase n=2 Tax=Staphylococcus haemolyticus TaxID=1283 RepID=UPI0011A3E5ED|nr:DNA adenine methylase [Staphylococcus haemolyticus]MCH4329571.1 DNA adenine methylase [Staphylococcus haemolyticus]MCH4408224.1 DNA adenine methylase [Staphylococcus haemolyticus]MDO0986835.1 DNA adenine methylase [Staphylococcus haemolyticus]
MRYLGNKTRLLNFIDDVIIKYNISGKIFVDLFAGTGAVSDFFKGKYRVIANDYMFYSTILARAKIENYHIPDFVKFRNKFNMDPFEWLNNKKYIPDERFFVLNNYAPQGNRQYFTNSNAIQIDGIRIELNSLLNDGYIEPNEFDFLLASLIESVTRFSNTSGTYQAFLKQWDKRALKDFKLEPLTMLPSLSVDKNNQAFNQNSNLLVRNEQLEGDIVYIDPPYTTTQYTNSYHVLETIARYDYPEIFGKTGRRVKREFSSYSNKAKALEEFEDLIRQLNIRHVLISYSNHSIIALEDLINIIKKFAINKKVNIETFDYRSYATNNKSYKEKNSKLQEIIIYFEKDTSINKSPLNYSGSKDKLLPKIFKHLPKHITDFVDCMGGAFNVGANVTAMNSVVYNEYNIYIFQIIKMLLEEEKDILINNIETIIDQYSLSKKNKDAYVKLRNDYNENPLPILLFVLQVYSFQNMIRFNQKQLMNVPVGNNEFNIGTKKRIYNFEVKSPHFELRNGSYTDINIEKYGKDTLFYFDPPYFITKAEYNDGKRGLEGWNEFKEKELFENLNKLNEQGYKFMLSNVLYHKGKTHIMLLNWIKEQGYNLIEIGKTGIKYPRVEIIVTNYKNFD